MNSEGTHLNFSNSLLLVYETHQISVSLFYILQHYWVHLFLIIFLIAYLGFSKYNVMWKQWQFYFFFSNLDSFYALFCLIAVAGKYWIKLVGILVLFLMLEEMFSVFSHRVCCWLWVCHIGHLLCWGIFPLYLLCLEFFS